MSDITFYLHTRYQPNDPHPDNVLFDAGCKLALYWIARYTSDIEAGVFLEF